MIGLLLQNWKYIAIAIAVVGFLYLAYDKVYTNGVMAERAVWEERIAEENAKNQKFTEELDETVTEMVEDLNKDETNREEKEKVQKEKIKEIISNNPEYLNCEIDEEVINALNAIGELGPNE